MLCTSRGATVEDSDDEEEMESVGEGPPRRLEADDEQVETARSAAQAPVPALASMAAAVRPLGPVLRRRTSTIGQPRSRNARKASASPISWRERGAPTIWGLQI